MRNLAVDPDEEFELKIMITKQQLADAISDMTYISHTLDEFSNAIIESWNTQIEPELAQREYRRQFEETIDKLCLAYPI